MRLGKMIQMRRISVGLLAGGGSDAEVVDAEGKLELESGLADFVVDAIRMT